MQQLELFKVKKKKNEVHPTIKKILKNFLPKIREIRDEEMADSFRSYDEIEPQKQDKKDWMKRYENYL
jgi:hypothetical protein